MSDTSPAPDLDGPIGRGPLTHAVIDEVLADFRIWLESVAAAPPAPIDPEPPPVDLATLVGAFTALRHEVNLQTKATRSQSEQLARTLDLLNASSTDSSGDNALRPLLETLIEMHDGLFLAARELAATRDTLPELPPPQSPNWWNRLFARAQSSEAGSVVVLKAARQRLSASVAGLQMTLRRVERALARHGLEAVSAENCPFDPEVMEALETVPAIGRPAGQVVEEVRRGYRWNGRVFRCAQVRVAK